MSTTIAANPTKQRPGARYFPGRLTRAEITAIEDRWQAMIGVRISPMGDYRRDAIAAVNNRSTVEIINLGDPANCHPEIDCVHWDEVEEPPLVHHPTEEEAFVYDLHERCVVPPPGWWCSREAGHDGPCAARPTTAPTASHHDFFSGTPVDVSEGIRWPEIKRCSVNLALRIRGACKRNDLRVGQLLQNAADFWAHVSVFELPDDKLAIYIDKIEDGRKLRAREANYAEFDKADAEKLGLGPDGANHLAEAVSDLDRGPGGG